VASPDGTLPDGETLAAIAAAYLVFRRRASQRVAPAAPAWRIAARFDASDPAEVRALSHIASRWSAAGRVR
jgi:hypothetical protein